MDIHVCVVSLKMLVLWVTAVVLVLAAGTSTPCDSPAYTLNPKP